MASNNGGKNALAQATMWLAVIGALNWGLVGLFNFDLVRGIFGHSASTDASPLSRIVYTLVGLAGIGLAMLAPRLRARDSVAYPVGGRTVEARP